MSQLISVTRPRSAADKEMVEQHGALWLVLDRKQVFANLIEARSIATGAEAIWDRLEYDDAEPA